MSDWSVPFGVYVHVPFCASKCGYCAFATWTDREHLVDAYLDAIERDLARAVAAGIPIADTVFVGGGTPTLVPPERLAEVIASIPTAPDAEITIECNPDDVTVELLGHYVEAGVNRVSIGVQSMVGHVLGTLGRQHDQRNVASAVAAVRAVGLPSFNLDVIYGAAGERPEDWEHTVRSVLELDPPHVSAYALTVEAGTPLAERPDLHPDDDDQADKYDVVDTLMEQAGLNNYEVSNWARPGHECRHNLLYWNQQDYLGIGCAAHSHHDGRRWWNVRTPDRYIELVGAGASTEAAGETLDADTRRLEALQLAVRLRDGVDPSAFSDHDRDELVAGGLLRHDGGRVVLTRTGRLMANAVSMRLR